eukprot:366160-Chlamydomonas_euryale.AAC.6
MQVCVHALGRHRHRFASHRHRPHPGKSADQPAWQPAGQPGEPLRPARHASARYLLPPPWAQHGQHAQHILLRRPAYASSTHLSSAPAAESSATAPRSSGPSGMCVGYRALRADVAAACSARAHCSPCTHAHHAWAEHLNTNATCCHTWPLCMHAHIPCHSTSLHTHATWSPRMHAHHAWHRTSFHTHATWSHACMPTMHGTVPPSTHMQRGPPACMPTMHGTAPPSRHMQRGPTHACPPCMARHLLPHTCNVVPRMHAHHAWHGTSFHTHATWSPRMHGTAPTARHLPPHTTWFRMHSIHGTAPPSTHVRAWHTPSPARCEDAVPPCVHALPLDTPWASARLKPPG